MIVCHCRAVSDRTIRACVRTGATSAEAISELTGAGGCCGGCEPAILDLIDEEAASAASGATRTVRPLRLVTDTRAA